MKKLAMILVGIFVLGQSFVMADLIMPPQKFIDEERICESNSGEFEVYRRRDVGTISGYCYIGTNEMRDIFINNSKIDRLNSNITSEEKYNLELMIKLNRTKLKNLQEQCKSLGKQRSDRGKNSHCVNENREDVKLSGSDLTKEQIIELRSNAEVSCGKLSGRFVNNKCDFSDQDKSGSLNNSGNNSGTQIIEPELMPAIITSGEIETSGKIEVDSGSSPETTGKIITSETQNNKTTIISIPVVLIGIGLIITAFRLRKLNQKNENPLPPQ